jgi:hypothetical protein
MIYAGVMSKLIEYERERLAKIRYWQTAGPDWGTRLLARPTSIAAKMVQTVVPVSAIQAALHGLNNVAERLSDQRSVIKRAGVADLAALREQPLQACDQLVQRVTRRAMGMGAGSGAVFGVVGAAGLVGDVPTLLTLALRTIHRIGLCYGEETSRDLAIGVFALASANTAAEKSEAILALRDNGLGLHAAAARDGLERAAERELAKEAAVFSLQTLAQRIGVQIGKRKAGSLIPVLGAVVGSAVNAWYLRDVAQVAQYMFQERWLLAKYPDLQI